MSGACKAEVDSRRRAGLQARRAAAGGCWRRLQPAGLHEWDPAAEWLTAPVPGMNEPLALDVLQRASASDQTREGTPQLPTHTPQNS